MLQEDLHLGGEQSGHFILREFATTGDGLVAALQVLRIMKSSQKPLSKLARSWTRFPQLLTNLVVKEKRPIEELSDVSALVLKPRKTSSAKADAFLLRYSGTEPKIRLLVEGRDAAVLQQWTQKITTLIKLHLG